MAIRLTSKDIKKFQKSSDLLHIYSRDRADYSTRESNEAKRLSVFLDKFVAKVLSKK